MSSSDSASPTGVPETPATAAVTPTPAGERQARDEQNWAHPVGRLAVPSEVAKVGYNVAGRRLTGPQQGFGRLWQRTYSVDLGSDVTPQELVADWRAHFGDFWPAGGVFYGGLTGIQPGSVAALRVGGSHGPKVATGVFVLYADDESFSFLTPEGHMFAGMITFSAETTATGTRAVIRILIRPNDPLWELAWPVARRKEDVFWSGTLKNLAASRGVLDAAVCEQTECLDRRRIWGNWRNLRYNAAIRSAVHPLTGARRGEQRAGEPHTASSP